MSEAPFAQHAIEKERSENDVNCFAWKEIQRDGNDHIDLKSFGLYISYCRLWETGLGSTFSPSFLL